MDARGKKVAIMVDNYFEQAEFEEPLQVLKEAGAEVIVVGATTTQLCGLHHVDKGDTYTADVLIQDVAADDYDALVLPGGAINADSLRMSEPARAWVRHFIEKRKPLAVICHAPWVLVSAGVVRSRKLTSYHTIQDDIVNAGGVWSDQEVVVDDMLITSRKPADLPAFNKSLLTLLAQ